MFFIGGAMAMVIRLELFKPGLQFVDPQFFNSMTTMHALIMIFGAVMPAWTGLANWMIPMQVGRARHGAAAPEQLQLLDPAVRLHAAAVLAVRARRRARGRLDHVSAAGAAERRLLPDGDLRHPHDGRLLDPGRHQRDRDHHEHARAGHDAAAHAAVRVDLADHRVPADRGDAGARRRGDDAAHRSLLRHHASSPPPAAAIR